jgi:hypothetical protein
MKLVSWGKILGIAVVLVASAAMAADISNLYVSGTWRYKMTVEIETPEGLKTGSAVHELSNSATDMKFMDFPEAGNAPKFKGEAVAIDLGKQGIVFAILPTDPYYMFFHTFYGNRGGATTVEGIRFFNSLKIGEKRTLPINDYPWFVMFKDINEPKTVMLVHGAEFDAEKQDYIPVDRFREVFGKGVKIKNIMLETTKEPVTSEIDTFLSKNFDKNFTQWWQSLAVEERSKLANLFNLKREDK